LAAAYECARRIRNGEAIVDSARYVRVRGEKLTREHGALWAALPDADPIDFARALEPGIGSTAVQVTQPTRVVDGVTHRFLPGTGWCPPLPGASWPLLAWKEEEG
jgi:hypothetical protein